MSGYNYQDLSTCQRGTGLFHHCLPAVNLWVRTGLNTNEKKKKKEYFLKHAVHYENHMLPKGFWLSLLCHLLLVVEFGYEK